MLNRLDLVTSISCFLSFYFALLAFENSGFLATFSIVMIVLMNVPVTLYFLYVVFFAYKAYMRKQYFKIKLWLVKFPKMRCLFSQHSRANLLWRRAFIKVRAQIQKQKGRRTRSLNSLFIPHRLTYDQQKKEFSFFFEENGNQIS